MVCDTRSVGVVTMDQLIVETTGSVVSPGDEVVLIGSQGDQTVTAQEWAWLTGTIPYEIVCGFSARPAAAVLRRGRRAAVTASADR